MAKRQPASQRAKSKRTATPKQAAKTVAAQPVESVRWPALLIFVCLFARWFMPTEGTLLGKTLWLAGGSFLSVAVYCWWQSRQISVPRFQFNRLDVTIAILALAHVISCCIVLTTAGQKRFAMTMLWEWTAVAIQFLALSHVMASRINRDTFRTIVLSMLIALSGYGVYQHWVEHPARVAEYTELRSRIDGIPNVGRTAQQDRELRELSAMLTAEQVPLEGPARELFERRLRDSIEPYGFFALANTFGGFMAVLVVLLLCELSSLENSPAKNNRFNINVWLRARWPWIVAFLIALYCLLLTKSRSAFLAAVAGMVVFGLQQLRARSKNPQLKKLMLGLAVATVVLVLLVAVLFASGSMDVEVFSEALKSLQYRIQYWTGTSKVIQDNPWFGVGPGNFRSHYLRHKLPDASEEIADPHQYLLDVFANSGILGLLAVLSLTGLFLRSLFRTPAETPNTKQQLATSKRTSEPLQSFATLTIVVSVVVVFAWQWLIEARTHIELLVVGGIAAVLSSIINRYRHPENQSSAPNEFSPMLGASAAAALFTHLLVAGGIAYPAVNLALFVFVAISMQPLAANERNLTGARVGDDSEDAGPGDEKAQAFRRATGWKTSATASLVLGVCAFAIGLNPILRSETALRFGDHILTVQGNMASARGEYQAAVEADPLSPAGHLSLAQLSFRSSADGKQEKYFNEAVQHAIDAIVRNPNGRIAHHLIAKWYAVRAKSANDSDAAAQALLWYEQALEGYPTEPIWNAEYTLALKAAGKLDQAKTQAETTLTLEKLNREAGHADRYLSDKLLDAVKSCLDSE